ncbi:hypothetical protein QCA50_002478 [Cerrena zonata]|uniref:Uncharacterized protein n=1 Tax=Cerrena zonata TaxID=2478898 RepID=A0AAW0GPG1_9APHY
MKGSPDVNSGHARSDSNVPLLPYAEHSRPSTPVTSKLSYTGRQPAVDIQRRRIVFLAGAVLSVVSVMALAMLTIGRSTGYVVSEMDGQFSLSSNTTIPPSVSVTASSDSAPALASPEASHEQYDEIVAVTPSYPQTLLGPPTDRFRDNLRNDTKYITSWISAGWNNDVMTYANLIYLGQITDRVPVIGLFTPSHIGGDAPPIAFGEVFNVSRFIEDSSIPIVEWDDVKNPDSEVVEDLGCWNIWEAVQYYEHHPRGSTVPDWVGLDISYTRGPDWLKKIPNYEHNKCSTFWALARLAYPEDRNKNIGNALPSPVHKTVLDPDEHMLCYDYLYYACADQEFEFEWEYAPAWKYVARYLRWSDPVQETAAAYVNRLFGLPDDAAVPPYITIHVRHGDFNGWCWEAETAEDCFAPLTAIARRVREVQDEIRVRKGIDIPMTRVIMTSDDRNETWWDEVKSYGWARMDHTEQQTVEHYGRWYPVILDSAIQSNGLGFVGTDRSTFSILSMRRVQDWHGGATRLVKWGKKDADAHRKRMAMEYPE